MPRRLSIALATAVASLVLAAPAGAASDPLRSQQWGLDLIESDAAHATATGTGAVVAVVDSGVLASHPDLQGRLLAGHDFVQNDGTPQDGIGHGTHVTGIIAADEGNGIGIAGVAPGAAVLPIRVLNDAGMGDAADVAAGIDYAVAHGAQVINLSLGTDVPLGGGDPDFDAALARAAAAGVVIVAAAGNDTIPFCEQPDVGGNLICVGAVDQHGIQSTFSNFSGDRGLMAPGGSNLPTENDILSTWKDGQYHFAAGTSQATPHVAGVAALLVSLGLRGKAIVDRLLATATDAGVPGPDPEYGAGIVNARAAVAGLTPPGGGGDGGGAAKGKASVRRTHRIRSVLKSGIRASCRPAKAGRCTVRVVTGGTTIAYGSAKTTAGKTVIVIARATKAGRSKLSKAKKTVKARAEIALPGAPSVVRSLSLKP